MIDNYDDDDDDDDDDGCCDDNEDDPLLLLSLPNCDDEETLLPLSLLPKDPEQRSSRSIDDDSLSRNEDELSLDSGCLKFGEPSPI